MHAGKPARRWLARLPFGLARTAIMSLRDRLGKGTDCRETPLLPAVVAYPVPRALGEDIWVRETHQSRSPQTMWVGLSTGKASKRLVPQGGHAELTHRGKHGRECDRVQDSPNDDRYLRGSAMEFTLSTPALLFSAISLLLLVYTNRFMVISQVIRGLHTRHLQSASEITRRQINNLTMRVELVKWMQLLAVFGFLTDTLAMVLFYYQYLIAAKVSFGLSMLALVGSLILYFYEVAISVQALHIELEDMR
jgi:hypothetical protein